MRGPLLSGPLGSASTLDAIMRWLGEAATVVVLGPPWMGAALAARARVLVLTEAENRERARRVARKAAAAGHRLVVALAAADLPLAAGSVDALVLESASSLDPDSALGWLTALVPVLRPGARVLAADATDDPATEARLSSLFLAAALTRIAQERPRDGTVLTMGAVLPHARAVAEIA